MKNFFRKLILSLLLFITIPSCISIPSSEIMQDQTKNFELPKKNDGQNVLVYVVRPSRFGAMIKFNVFVDHKDDASKVGYTTGKKYIYFFVKPGPHKIFSTAENTAEIGINGSAGETIFMRQDPSTGFIWARNNLEIIDEIEAKYHIKDIKEGVILQEKFQTERTN